MMQLIIGQVSQEGIGQLNQRFWDRFDQADFKDTILALAYMRMMTMTSRLIQIF